MPATSPRKEALAAVGYAARALPRPEDPLRQRRGPVQAAAGDRASARLADRDFDSLFTTDKPIIFNFHGYPWLIHRLAYRRTNHENLHVRGYKEKGNINTPLDLAIQNEIDRFSLAIDVIDRVPALARQSRAPAGRMQNAIVDNMRYAHEHGADRPELANWVWPL